ncbi:hypothetical protein BOX15_Mlig024552g1, partial [Macrostomum lignano]
PLSESCSHKTLHIYVEMAQSNAEFIKPFVGKLLQNLFGHETSTKLQSASVKGVDAGSLQAYIVGKSSEATTAAAVDQFCQLLASIWHRLQDSIAARIAVTFGFEMPDLLLAVLARCCSQPGKEGSVQAGQIGPLVDQLQAGDLISSVHQYLTDGGYCGEVWATLRWKLLPDAVDALLGMGKADRSLGLSSLQRTPEAAAPAAAAAAAAAEAECSPEQRSEQDTDKPDSSACRACQSNQVNRVCLPCRHLVICSRCSTSRSQCPRCGASVLAFLPAFLT